MYNKYEYCMSERKRNLSKLKLSSCSKRTKKMKEKFHSARTENCARSCSPKIVVSTDENTSSALVDIHKPTTQMGMDRLYMRVVKRQRNPNLVQLSSNAKFT